MLCPTEKKPPGAKRSFLNNLLPRAPEAGELSWSGTPSHLHSCSSAAKYKKSSFYFWVMGERVGL